MAARRGDRRPDPDAPLLRRRLAPVRLPLLPRLGPVRHRPVRPGRGPPRAGSGSGWKAADRVRRRGHGASASTGRTRSDASTCRIAGSSSSRSSCCPARPASIDEIVWSRQLVLVFGNTTQAVSAILTGFFGGHGDRQLRRRPDRRPGPLAAADVRPARARPRRRRPRDADLVPADQRGCTAASTRASRRRRRRSRSCASVLAVLALAPATILMGATLPTLTRHLARDATPEPGRSAGCTRRTRSGRSSGRSLAGLRPDRAARPVRGARGRGRLLGDRRAGGALAGSARGAAGAVDASTAGAVEPAATAVADGAVATASGARPTPRLALTVAFVSGLTSLGYQVLDPPARVGDRQHDLRVHDDPGDVPDRARARGGRLRGPPDADRATRPAARGQPGRRGGARARRPRLRPRRRRTSRPRASRSRPSSALFGSALLVVLPVTIVLGHRVPGVVGAPRRRRGARRRRVRRAARGEHGRRDRRQPASSRSS